ncbi:MAG: hypothetical protein WBC91_26515 [Phototrophicaceae bacterium]
MMELIQKITDTVTTNGGEMEWSELVASLDYSERAKVGDALKVAKNQGTLQREIRRENGANLHVVKLVVPVPGGE